MADQGMNSSLYSWASKSGTKLKAVISYRYSSLGNTSPIWSKKSQLDNPSDLLRAFVKGGSGEEISLTTLEDDQKKPLEFQKLIKDYHIGRFNPIII
ncbi:hypothetical protein BC937DRAFT_95635, partial [Endogone sp. FLAS-F59071]